MSACVRKDDIAHAVRAGHWPQGALQELREHVAECALCAEDARVMTAFAMLRDGAMRVAVPQNAGLLWWKAQLRRRHALERIERPGMAISTMTVSASIVILLIVLATVWRRVEWSRLGAVFSTLGWSGWVTGSVVAMVCAFLGAAIFVGLGLSEER